MYDLGSAPGQPENKLCELQHGRFDGIAEVHRPDQRRLAVHEQDKRSDHIVDITEAPRLPSVTEDGDRFAAYQQRSSESLGDAAIIHLLRFAR